MNIETEKQNIKRQIDEVEDIEILEIISKLLENPMLKQGGREIMPMTNEEYHRMIEESEESIRQGNTTSLEELEEEMKHW